MLARIPRVHPGRGALRRKLWSSRGLARAGLSAALFAAGLAAQGGAILLKDINSSPLEPSGFQPYNEEMRMGHLPNGGVLFAGIRTDIGMELYSTIGFPGSTFLVRDINPGPSHSMPSGFFALGNATYFFATTAAEGRELWKTDGSLGGTVLVKDTLPGPGSGAYALDFDDLDLDRDQGCINAIGSTLYCLMHGARGLFRSDGTTAGTTLVKTLSPYRHPADYVYLGEPLVQLCNAGGTLYFAADDGTGSGTELWKSDGTTAGTVMVKDIQPGSGSSNPGGFVEFQGQLFFRADDGTNGMELWKSDGTAAGTVMVKDVNVGANPSNPSNLTVLGSALMFSADDGAVGAELWKTDGTTAGTAILADLSPTGGSMPREMQHLGNLLVFKASYDLWATDGAIVTSLSGGRGYANQVANPVAASGRVYFGSSSGTGYELWATDGTIAGTGPVLTQNNSNYSTEGPQLITESIGARVVFANTDDAPAHGLELWASDGTAAGTGLLEDINPPNPAATDGSFNQAGVAVGGNLYFRANDGGTYGSELWKTDGTTAGTALVADINPTGSGNPYAFTSVNGTVFFTANDGNHGSELWTTDGTTAGTAMVVDINPGTGQGVSGLAKMTGLNGILLFPADDGTGIQLWRSDGTPAGTYRISTGISLPGTFHALNAYPFGSEAYFWADGGSGVQLWKTDGTMTGTVQVKQINPGGSAYPGDYSTNMAAAGGLLFFGADDGVHGTELWVSDGTATGTRLVKDINPGPMHSGIDATDWNQLVAVGNRVFFFANDGVHGYELWVSDGTTAGTRLVVDLFPGSGGVLDESSAYIGTLTVAFSRLMVEFQGKAMFVASDGVHGRELWMSDGTAAGTVLVKDIEPGGNSSNPINFRYFGGGEVFFAATNSTYGREIWRTDGTTAGTQIAADVVSGNGSGWAGDSEFTGPLYLLRDRLIIAATHPVYGLEMFAVPIGASVQQVGFDKRIGINWLAGGLPWTGGSGCSTTGIPPLLDSTKPVLGGSVQRPARSRRRVGTWCLGVRCARWPDPDPVHAGRLRDVARPDGTAGHGRLRHRRCGWVRVAAFAGANGPGVDRRVDRHDRRGDRADRCRTAVDRLEQQRLADGGAVTTHGEDRVS